MCQRMHSKMLSPSAAFPVAEQSTLEYLFLPECHTSSHTHTHTYMCLQQRKLQQAAQQTLKS
jgi:hypothetical protein